jgi:hypothetical protein
MKMVMTLVGLVGFVAVGCVTSNSAQNESLTGSWSLKKVTCTDKAQEAVMNEEIQKQDFVVAYEFKDKHFNEKMTEKSQRARRNISQVTTGTFEARDSDLILIREKTELMEAGKTTHVPWNKDDVMKIKKVTKSFEGKSLVISSDDACAISSGSLHFVQI